MSNLFKSLEDQFAEHLSSPNAVYKPGEITKVLRHLPQQRSSHILEVAALYADQVDAGRHGDTKLVADSFEVPEVLAQKLHEHIESDSICYELQKRRGCDADTHLPELTRRDIIKAQL